MTKKNRSSARSPADLTALAITLAFTALVSLFAIRSNDVWWMLAVGRRLVETRAFITEDPFTFTAAGTPWAPQAYLSALLFYFVHRVFSPVGLVVLRALLVVSIFTVSLRTVARLGVSYLTAAPVVLLVLLNAHSRFLIRAHLFEYLFLALLVGFLLSVSEKRGKTFFVFPVVIQLLWVNMHPSFLLGPALVVLFYGGEWIAGALSKRVRFVRPYYRKPPEWRRVGLLLLLLAAACAVNPAPGMFLSQPFAGEHRELLSHFTLEWRSPFDPALSAGAFHPYYEILLALALLSVLAAITRLPLAPALLMAATALLSLESHRFRVEFALVALPVVFVLFSSSALAARLNGLTKNKFRRMAARAAAAAASLLLIVTAWDRVSIGPAVSDRFPDRAFDFIRAGNVAHRSFHTIGFGSYLLWDLYGERRSFIDGRNFSPALYRDFLAAQGSPAGPGAVARKYKLDSFVIPPEEDSDAGMRNIHGVLSRDASWRLVHLDDVAWVYVRKDAVPADWLSKNGYSLYNPVTLPGLRMDDSTAVRLLPQIGRAVEAAPDYVRPRLDLAAVYVFLGDDARALEQLDAAAELDPGSAVIWNRIGNAALDSGQHQRSIDAFLRLKQLAPRNPAASLSLGRAYAAADRRADALRVLEGAVSADPKYVDAYVLMFEINARERYWDEAGRIAERLRTAAPDDYRGFYYLAVTSLGLGRGPDAIRNAQSALRINPRAVEVYLILAEAYARGQNRDEALRCVERALEIAPDNEAALDARERLRSVQP